MSFWFAGPVSASVLVVAVPATGIGVAAATDVVTVSPLVSRPTLAPCWSAVNEWLPRAVTRPAATSSATVSVAVNDTGIAAPTEGVNVTFQASPATTGVLTVSRLAATEATAPLIAVVVVPLVFDSVGAETPETVAMTVITAPLALATRSALALASPAISAAACAAVVLEAVLA